MPLGLHFPIGASGGCLYNENLYDGKPHYGKLVGTPIEGASLVGTCIEEPSVVGTSIMEASIVEPSIMEASIMETLNGDL